MDCHVGFKRKPNYMRFVREALKVQATDGLKVNG